jgi:Rrf2 family transcriptional regulator, iron-sulfur cluster assembly transcription factor
MLYSNACAYAIRAMTRLAVMRTDGYVLLDDLCADSDLPRHFVAKIFQDLVRRGLLVSAKGRGGGFALARPAEKITLMDIVAIVDGTEDLDACVVGMSRCDDTQPCPHHDQWQPIRKVVKDFLNNTTLANMSKSMESKLDALGQELPAPKSVSKPVRRRS